MRTKRGFVRKRRVKRLLKEAKGYHGSRSKLYRSAKETHRRALWYSRSGRRLKKRDFRRLWITRIRAASNMRDMSYSKFIGGLKKAGVLMNRKILANLALTDQEAFDQLVVMARQAL
ncbi:MAG: 50S ribosomal protein L20 [Planctomycetes bacterium]|nr:50S ribosomal protein L20 [Planctomycetota bacterium]